MSEITPNTPNPVREDAYKQQLAAKLGIDPQYIPGSPIWHSEEEIAAIAEMFSNMAGGGSSGGGVLVVHMSAGTLDKTWLEIAEAVPEKPVLIIFVYGGKTTVLHVVSVTQAIKPGMESYVQAFSPASDFATSIVNFTADAFDSYPVIQE